MLLELQTCLFYKLDLLGRFGHADRAAAPFEPSAHANAAAFTLLWLHARGGECPLLAFKNGDSEIPRPAPPEIDIHSGPTFAHRQDLAFDQCETTLLSR